LNADAQARLLRFLNDRRFERLGEAIERKADVRLIIATNRSLEDEVKAGRFREDLFFRLNVIALTVPPLRERREDLLALAQHYLRFFESRQGRLHLSFSPHCVSAIMNYFWPGNLRELRNAVERAVILSPASILEAQDLGLDGVAEDAGDGRSIAASDGGETRDTNPILGENCSIADIEREHIARVVAHAASFEAAAQILGIDPTTLQRKRKRYGIA